MIVSSNFGSVNRGKLGMTLDLKSDAAPAMLRRLVEWGDVVAAMFGQVYLEIRLDADDEDPENARRLVVRPVGPGWAGRWDALGRSVGEWTC